MNIDEAPSERLPSVWYRVTIKETISSVVAAYGETFYMEGDELKELEKLHIQYQRHYIPSVGAYWFACRGLRNGTYVPRLIKIDIGNIANLSADVSGAFPKASPSYDELKRTAGIRRMEAPSANPKNSK
jgi:hypothetical protein